MTTAPEIAQVEPTREAPPRVGFAARARAAMPTGASLWATLTWAVGFPLAVLLVKLLDGNPLTGRGSVGPVAIGIIGGVVLLVLVVRRYSDAILGLAAGGYAAWCGLTLVASYHGTPFGDSGLRGDSARLATMATRFSTTWQPVDGIVPSVPAEYPPLFPWLLGRLSTIIDRPAWSLIGYGEAALISAAVLFAFLLWRGIVPTPVALALAVLPPWVFAQPRKSYEIITIAVFVPWVLRTFTNRSRSEGGLHWLSAGIIGGLLVQTYQGYLLFGVLGILAIMAFTWHGAADRMAYLRHVIGAGLTAFVVASWYLVPYLYGTLVLGGSRVNDYFISPAIVEDPLGVWFLTGPFVNPLYMIELVGLLGLVWYWKTRWWARPMLLLVAGVYVYRWALVLIFVSNGHTLYLHYTTRLIGLVFASAGILTVIAAVPALARRVTTRSLRGVGVLSTAALLVVAAMAGLGTWMPWPRGINDVSRPVDSYSPNLATYTHAEPLPNGKRAKYAPKGVTVAWFPAEPIREVVEGTLGEGARPSTLAYDERMFAYYPWKGYVAVERLASNTFSHWDERHAELVRIAGIKDPAEFARASADTEYGGIDVFVLRRRGAGWMWGDVVFDAAQFSPTYWRVADDLPSNTAVAVRLPG
ncbi:arabinofuranosyltransferase [Plantactinospora soyae]|uniref:Arabinofuranosyltransferase AftA C-terminal domain-containing protein n=1 Tax=Plantactinospora soyae TaxID=1544732 RepID=A0A927QY03_9ACTN|nr:arabinofuranosyltransferase [Plantactinospora soyae]MBE1488670.1 hypothetical protein [Plantactinospora soyae]